MINSYDIDGVITYDGKFVNGIIPGPNDIIITGRSYEEAPETYDMLHRANIFNIVFFNPTPVSQKTREISGIHKGKILKFLIQNGMDIVIHYEDDEVQIEEIKKYCPNINIVHLVHDLTKK